MCGTRIPIICLSILFVPVVGCGDSCKWYGDAFEGMIKVPAGAFIAGCDPSKVYDPNEFDLCNGAVLCGVSADVHGFYMDEFEVTNQAYAEFLNCQGNQCGTSACYGSCNDNYSEPQRISIIDGEWFVQAGFEDHPVVDVTWWGARAFCEWRGARLPNLIEWEYAARGEESLVYPWGSIWIPYLTSNGLADYLRDGIYPGSKENLSDECREFLEMPISTTTLPKGCFVADISPFGIRDMAGNVREILEDDYMSRYTVEESLGMPVSEDKFAGMVPLDGSTWIAEPRSDSKVAMGGSISARRGLFAVFQAKWDESSFCGSPRFGFRCAADE